MSSCGFSQTNDDAFSRGRGVKERRSGDERREGGRRPTDKPKTKLLLMGDHLNAEKAEEQIDKGRGARIRISY